MIPNIIHLCWLSGDAFPDSIMKCLQTWGEYLADYEIFLWGKTPEDTSCLGGMKVTEKHFDLDSTPWTKEAFEAKKYAFAADYIRLYALYTYGGIYLDADVVVYKSFDELLHLPYFIGCDQIRAFEAAVIGAEKGCFWIKEVLDTYQGKHFKTPSNSPCLGGESFSYDMLELPVRFHHVLTDIGYKFYKVDSVVNANFREGSASYRKLFVFNKEFFNSRDAVEVRQTERSFCAHNYMGSWQKKTKKSFKDRLPKQLLKIIYTVGQATWARNKYAWFQIPFEK